MQVQRNINMKVCIIGDSRLKRINKMQFRKRTWQKI